MPFHSTGEVLIISAIILAHKFLSSVVIMYVYATIQGIIPDVRHEIRYDQGQ